VVRDVRVVREFREFRVIGVIGDTKRQGAIPAFFAFLKFTPYEL